MFSSEVTGGSEPAVVGSLTMTIFWSIVTVKMACERDEASFISVEEVILEAIPLLSN